MRYRKSRSGALVGILLPVGLVCLFALCSLALALWGGGAYREIQDRVDDGYESAVAASYLRTKLSQNNFSGAVEVRDENGTQVLVISSSTAAGQAYEARIYYMDGRLMESSVFAGTPFEPSSADILIANVAGCSFELGEDGLFTAEITSHGGTLTRTAFAMVEGGGL